MLVLGLLEGGGGEELGARLRGAMGVTAHQSQLPAGKTSKTGVEEAVQNHGRSQRRPL